MTTPVHAVLFDLDGTLVDSAPDLLGSLSWVCAQQGQPPPDLQALRSRVSHGALGLLSAVFDERQAEALRGQFIAHYQAHLWQRSTLFAGILPVLDRLRSQGLPLAVVTNKMEALARPVLEASGLSAYFTTVVAGDTATRPKPAPDPVHLACERLGVRAQQVVLVGDDARDVQAAQAAGAVAAVAAWGYLPSRDTALAWRAEWWLEQPAQLLQRLGWAGSP